MEIEGDIVVGMSEGRKVKNIMFVMDDREKVGRRKIDGGNLRYIKKIGWSGYTKRKDWEKIGKEEVNGREARIGGENNRGR